MRQFDIREPIDAMRETNKNEFFKIVGPQDVTPKVRMTTLKDRYYISDWEKQGSRSIIGVTSSDSWGIEPTKFYLVRGSHSG